MSRHIHPSGVRRLRRTLGALFASSALLLSACGGVGTSTSSGEKDPDATLRLTFAGVPSLDPAQTPASTAVLSNTWPVYDRLIQISEEGEYLPMLATNWAFSPEGDVLRLDLRKGVTFSDGTPFTAATVVANVARYQVEPVSKASASLIAGVDVVDDHTVDLRLNAASNAILGALSAAAPGIMISEEALDAPDLGTNPVGSGAWVIDEFRPGEKVSFKRRTDAGGIWDPLTGQVDRVEIAVRTTPSAYAAIRSGQADVVLSNGDVNELQSGIDAGTLKVRPLANATTTATLFLNQTVEPFDDVRLRQAVNHAINREVLVDALVPTTTPRVQPWAPVVNGFDESFEQTYPYDPAKAEQLVADAGYPDGVDAGTFYVANYEPMPEAAQIVQADLAAVGIRIELELYDLRQLLSGLYGESKRPGQFNLLAYPSLEPGVGLKWFLDNPLTLPGGVPDDIVQQISKVDDSLATQEERGERAASVVEWAVDNAVYAPLWQGVPGWVTTDKVQGIEPGKAFLAPLGGQDFRYAWISE